MRHVVLHYHIFKNAGTTIDSILLQNFASCHGHIEGQNPWDTLTTGTILQYVQQNSALKALSTHHGRLPVPAQGDIAFYPLLFLRHPIDRVGSVYSFERRQPIGSPSLGVKIAHTNDFKGYVKWRLANGNGAVIKNFQVVHLAGRDRDMRTATATREDLLTASERLGALEFFGIVDLFSQSISSMAEYLSKGFGPLNMSCRTENRSLERLESLEKRVDEIKASLGSTLYDELIEKNRLDLELYDFARTLFCSSIALEPPTSQNDRAMRT